MTEFIARIKDGAPVPLDETGRKALRKYEGRTVKIDMKVPRNIRFHRKLFAMLQIVFENQDHYKSLDLLLDVCKLETGHCHVIKTRRKIYAIPKSISFAQLDETAFNDFYKRATHWVAEEVIPGLNLAELDAEVEARLLEFGQ